MKAEELRIGNWYQWYAEGKYYEYQVIQSDFSNDCNFLNFEPIQLTENWLRDKSGYGLVSIESNLWISEKENSIFYLTDDKDDFISYNPIRYVHQLQNLYFALTGTELTIK
jgi:hypothetical protein